MLERQRDGIVSPLTLFVESKCCPVSVIEYSTRQVTLATVFGAQTFKRGLVFESELDKFQSAIAMKAKEVADAMRVELKVVDLCKQAFARKLLRKLTGGIPIPSLVIPERLWFNLHLNSVLSEILSRKDSLNLESLSLLHSHVRQNSRIGSHRAEYDVTAISTELQASNFNSEMPIDHLSQ